MCQRVQRTRHSITFSCVPVRVCVVHCGYVSKYDGCVVTISNVYLRRSPVNVNVNVNYGELMQRKQTRIGVCEVRRFTTTHDELVLEIWSVVRN